MGFLTSLFGSSKKESFQDSDLGNFTELNRRGDIITWKGQIRILNETVSLFMSGNSDQLNASEKAALSDIFKNETTIESEIDGALRTQYEEADKKYSKWQEHFNCIALSTMNNEISITFEEKESLYQFNVFFLNGKADGVSIDS